VIVEAIVENKNTLIVRIEDNGRGMSQNQISRIAALAQFDRDFYEQQGVGLGLVIAKKVTELHDGNFQINSKEGKGTIVNLTIPCFFHTIS